MKRRHGSLRFLFVMHRSIAELANLLGLRFQGDGTHVVTRVSNWEEADVSCLIFNDGKMRTASAYEVPRAGCLIAPKELLRTGWNAIISAQPKLDFARASAYLEPRPAGTGI